MVQIYFDCGLATIQGAKWEMAAEMVFSRYEGENRERCVFAEHSTTSTRDRTRSEAFNKRYERTKFETWQENMDMYLGADTGAKEQGGRFDLPPYQIRIKTRANDTELPNLEYDFQKKEISFEWEGMFARFYYETAMLEMREHKTMTEAMDWIDGKDCSIAGAMAVSQKAKQARWCTAKELRRDRIKKWYLEKHNRHFKDDDFEEDEEDQALDAIQDFELHGDLARSAEDTESRRVAETNTQSQEMFEMLEMI